MACGWDDVAQVSFHCHRGSRHWLTLVAGHVPTSRIEMVHGERIQTLYRRLGTNQPWYVVFARTGPASGVRWFMLWHGLPEAPYRRRRASAETGHCAHCRRDYAGSLCRTCTGTSSPPVHARFVGLPLLASARPYWGRGVARHNDMSGAPGEGAM